MRQRYETPAMYEVGKLEQVTLGGPGSRCDGYSGGDGNNGATDKHGHAGSCTTNPNRP